MLLPRRDSSVLMANAQMLTISKWTVLASISGLAFPSVEVVTSKVVREGSKRSTYLEAQAVLYPLMRCRSFASRLPHSLQSLDTHREGMCLLRRVQGPMSSTATAMITFGIRS